MKASWRFMRNLDGRLRQHDRRTGCSGYRGDGNGICPCGGFHRLLHPGNVPAPGNQPGALVPVGVLMALTGYVIGTGGGIIAARIMGMFA